MTHLGHAEVAMGRLATIGRSTVPMGFQDVFDLEMQAIGIPAHMHEQEGLVVDDFNPSMSSM
jgi:hypothetical protein